MRFQTFEPTDVIIQLGPGDKARAYPFLDVVGELMADASVAEMVADRVLDSFPADDLVKVAREWLRVLRPAGKIELRSENDRTLVVSVLKAAGFIDIQCAGGAITATRPRSFRGKVRCAMSTGRLGFMDHFFMWSEALLPLGIVPSRYVGADWGQCLERVMEKHVDSCDWILTVDHDTAFTKDDVKRLLATAATHPEADAIAPVQLKRGTDPQFLFCIKGEDGKPLIDYPEGVLSSPMLKVSYAHFGLTLIRASKLAAMPHPWFVPVPNEQGRWGEGRLDSDVNFWEQWERAGNSLYVATNVVVGHGDYYVVVPGNDGKPVYVSASDYQTKGPPPETLCP
jgi:hypothetical protein